MPKLRRICDADGNSFAMARYADDQDDGLIEIHVGDLRAETVPLVIVGDT